MSDGAKRGLIAFAVILAAIIALGWAFWGSRTTVRSRLTLVVETPEGERSGSSVSQVTISSPGPLNRAIGLSSLRTAGEEGEALVVDLGARGLLFATLARESALRSGGMGMYNAGLTPFPQEKFRGAMSTGIGAKDEYRTGPRPTIQIEHHKTGAVVNHPLEERMEDGSVVKFYADAEAVLTHLSRRGLPMILR
jgi:hypothetical protein